MGHRNLPANNIANVYFIRKRYIKIQETVYRHWKFIEYGYIYRTQCSEQSTLR